jgi:hypothetical protein
MARAGNKQEEERLQGGQETRTRCMTLASKSGVRGASAAEHPAESAACAAGAPAAGAVVTSVADT